MNKNSNTYIIIYATVMVIVVASVLSFAALSLKGVQAENVVIEKKGDILTSIGEDTKASEVADKNKYINEMYQKYITSSYAVNSKGDVVEGVDPFNILINLKAEYEKPVDQRELPVFVGKKDDGTILNVIPVWGVGLWGPLWGYIALEKNWDTVSGVVFDHKSETPGLGAEITTSTFESQFKNKQIFKDGKFVSIGVLKGSGSSAGNNHAVDAISGGTITSRGVESMIKDCLSDYAAYFEKQHAALSEATVTVVDSTAIIPTDSLKTVK